MLSFRGKAAGGSAEGPDAGSGLAAGGSTGPAVPAASKKVPSSFFTSASSAAAGGSSSSGGSGAKEQQPQPAQAGRVVSFLPDNAGPAADGGGAADGNKQPPPPPDWNSARGGGGGSGDEPGGAAASEQLEERRSAEALLNAYLAAGFNGDTKLAETIYPPPPASSAEARRARVPGGGPNAPPLYSYPTIKAAEAAEQGQVVFSSGRLAMAVMNRAWRRSQLVAFPGAAFFALLSFFQAALPVLVRWRAGLAPIGDAAPLDVLVFSFLAFGRATGVMALNVRAHTTAPPSAHASMPPCSDALLPGYIFGESRPIDSPPPIAAAASSLRIHSLSSSQGRWTPTAAAS